MSFWRKELPVLRADRSIEKGGMWGHQRTWWDLENFLKVLVTGYGGGKTFIAAKRAIALALHNSPSPHLQVSPTYKMARRTIIPALNVLLDGKRALTQKKLWWNYNKTEHEYEIRYRGRQAFIWVGSGDDPDSLKGPTVGSAGVDEPFIQSSEVLDQCVARVRDPIAPAHEIFLTGTPEELNWGYDICEGERVGEYDVGVVHASTRGNLALGPEYADRMERSYTDQAVEAYVEGKFVNLTTGQVYYGFSDANIVDIPDPGHELRVGMDFNVNPMASLVFWINGPHMHVVEDIELPHADTQYMCDYLLQNYRWNNLSNEHPDECRVRTAYPDASGAARSTKSPGGKSDYHYIREAGFIIEAPYANPHVRDRENAVNGKLAPKMGEPTLTVSPRCKRLIGYLRKYTHENKNKQKGMSHLLDALGYPCHRLYPIVRTMVQVTRTSGH